MLDTFKRSSIKDVRSRGGGGPGHKQAVHEYKIFIVLNFTTLHVLHGTACDCLRQVRIDFIQLLVQLCYN